MSALSQKRGAAIIEESSKTPPKALKTYVDIDAMYDDPLHALCQERNEDYAGLEQDLKMLEGYDMMVAKYEAMHPVHTMGRPNAFDVILMFYQPTAYYHHPKSVVITLTGGSFCARHRKRFVDPMDPRTVSIELVRMISHISAKELATQVLEKATADARVLVPNDNMVSY